MVSGGGRMSNDSSGKARLRAVAHGLVQGVGFRYYVLSRARLLGVTGYVRNAPDGTVETVAEGERELLEQLLEAIERGPVSASVRYVERQWLPYRGQYYRFDVRG